MLQCVEVAPRRLTAYERLIPEALYHEIADRAASLRGSRVVHINATPQGGGVAEILHSLVPLLQSVGVRASWYVLPPDDAFFEVTKRLHNWLQGAPGHVHAHHKRVYQEYLERLGTQMQDLDADVWIVHDPQPLPLVALAPLKGRTVWRCHIDCSSPNGGVREYLLPWIRQYDRAIFSMPEYVLGPLSADQVRIMYPAIDPLTRKNRRLSLTQARGILAGLGIDPGRPLVTQVSRFDPWKNPWQAVDAYRLAKGAVPGLQLALVGVFSAKDDPEAPRIYEEIVRYADSDPDIHLFADASCVGAREVNAFQTGSDVVLQRSVREGFGLVVTEAMWKARPVVATPVGGIGVQIDDGVNGFLTETTDGCAARMVELLREPRLARDIGRAARATVRGQFLLPRLLRDHLDLYDELLQAQQGPTAGRVTAHQHALSEADSARPSVR
jgi:trehalose synthase